MCHADKVRASSRFRFTGLSTFKLIMSKALKVVTTRPSSFNALHTKNEMRVGGSAASTRYTRFPPSPHVYIGNIPAERVETDVRSLFESITGNALKRLYLRQKYPGGCQHAFILTSSTLEASRCIDELNGLKIAPYLTLKVCFFADKNVTHHSRLLSTHV